MEICKKCKGPIGIKEYEGYCSNCYLIILKRRQKIREYDRKRKPRRYNREKKKEYNQRLEVKHRGKLIRDSIENVEKRHFDYIKNRDKKINKVKEYNKSDKYKYWRREYNKKRSQTEKYKAWRRAFYKKYNQRPEVKKKNALYKRLWRDKENGKEKARVSKYQKSPKGRIQQKKRRENPQYKEKQRGYYLKKQMIIEA